MACAEYSFHVPSLEELVGVLQKGLTDNFAEVQVSVVDCPEFLSPETPGLICGWSTLIVSVIMEKVDTTIMTPPQI